ncbi:hypothetical protein VSK91_19690 [Bacillus swezeyi]|nr:hypothetical protein [Bacillus swezeyi]MED2945404.1 hypothetical protein [Bacillus swezeyi]MED2979648.1 hypothetical protein [Bacillus swezeyi]
MKKLLVGVAVVAVILIAGFTVAQTVQQANAGYNIAGFPRGA